MARLRNRATGSVIRVNDDAAARYPARAWEPLDKPPPPQKPAEEPAQPTPAKKAPAKKRAQRRPKPAEHTEPSGGGDVA
ncbi:MAG: hypothetical protein J2O47_02930 [Acidimicrobiaceae bacterium]|nr:hypothetical protein [Acidimicrobiaceae bacterium]